MLTVTEFKDLEKFIEHTHSAYGCPAHRERCTGCPLCGVETHVNDPAGAMCLECGKPSDLALGVAFATGVGAAGRVKK